MLLLGGETGLGAKRHFRMGKREKDFRARYVEAMVPAVPVSGFDTEGSVDPHSACRLRHVVAEARLTEFIATIRFDPPPRPRTVPEYLAQFSRATFGWRLRQLAEELLES